MPLGLGMNDANQESDMADGSIRLHVVPRNLQSIRTEARFNDFLVETVSCDFDVLFVSETWRDAKEESYTAIGRNRMYFSGGLAHQGVGVIIGNTFHSKLRDISFHAYSPRICVLKCSLGMLKLELFAVYFPTSWDDILEVEGLYTLLQVLLDKCVSRGRTQFLVVISMHVLDLFQEVMMLTWLDASALVNAMLRACCSHNGSCKMDFTLPTGKNQPTRLKTVGLAGVQVTEL